MIKISYNYLKIIKTMKLKIGKDIYNFGKKIWSYNRSITGKGTLKTLQEVKKLLPELKIKS